MAGTYQIHDCATGSHQRLYHWTQGLTFLFKSSTGGRLILAMIYLVRDIDFDLLQWVKVSITSMKCLTKFHIRPGHVRRSSSNSKSPVFLSGTEYMRSASRLSSLLLSIFSFLFRLGDPWILSFWSLIFRGFSKATLRRSICSSSGICLFKLE